MQPGQAPCSGLARIMDRGISDRSPPTTFKGATEHREVYVNTASSRLLVVLQVQSADLCRLAVVLFAGPGGAAI